MNSCHLQPVHRGAYPTATRNNVCHIRNANNNGQIIIQVSPGGGWMCRNHRERIPDPPGWRSETGGSLVAQSRPDRSVWENSATDQNIPESGSAHFSSKHSIEKTAEPDGEGVKKVQSQTCAGTEEWTCTICKGEIIHGRMGGGWGVGRDKTNRIDRDEWFTMRPPSEEVQIQQLLPVLSKSLKSGIRGASQPTACQPK